MKKERPVIEFLTNNYGDLLKIALMMLHNLDAAQDVVQNVAVSIYTKQEKLGDVTNPSTFFFTCLRRAALNHIRVSARALPTDPAEIAEFRVDPKNKVALDYVEWEIILRKHLQDYSEELIQVFIDHYMNDYPLEQLAFELGITPNALAQQFKRMRVRIVRCSPKMALYMFILTMR